MKLLCATAVFLCASMAFGQLKLIPTPQRVEIKDGTFSFDRKVSLVTRDDVAVKLTPLEPTAVEQLKDELKEDFGFELAPQRSTFVHILIVRAKELPTGLKSPDGYTLAVTSDKIELRSQSDEGLFDGIQTL